MAVLNGNLYLSLPACKIAQKAKKCNKCQYESCCGLAERNVRLYARGEITPERFQELRTDLEGVCPIASIYEAWLLPHIRSLSLVRVREARDVDNPIHFGFSRGVKLTIDNLGAVPDVIKSLDSVHSFILGEIGLFRTQPNRHASVVDNTPVLAKCDQTFRKIFVIQDTACAMPCDDIFG